MCVSECESMVCISSAGFMSACNFGFAEPRPLTQFVLNEKDKLFLWRVG